MQMLINDVGAEMNERMKSTSELDHGTKQE
jgi:hypothetical protein